MNPSDYEDYNDFLDELYERTKDRQLFHDDTIAERNKLIEGIKKLDENITENIRKSS